MKQPELGKKIAELRKGLTQEELVDRCNLNVRTLQRIESGVVTPRNYTVKAIFAELEYNIDSFNYTSNKVSQTKIVISWLEQSYKYVFDLFNLKTHTMKKISILSTTFIFLGLSLFFIFSEGKAQKSIYMKYASTDGRGIIYLFPKGLSIHISNSKDTAKYEFGTYLILEFKDSIYFKGDLIGTVEKGDTVLLENGNLSIKNAFWKFISTNGNGIIYRISSKFTMQSCSVQKDKTERLYLSDDILIQEHKNKIYLNNSYIGEAYNGDIVVLENGTLSIEKKY